MQLIQLKAIFLTVSNLLSRAGWRRHSLPVLVLASFAAGSAVADPIDAGLFTYYTLTGAGTKVHWNVCGQTKQTSGCYSGGDLGPFGKVGALLEGVPSTNTVTNTVTRAIYILDIAGGSGKTGVDLYIYQKNDVISASQDTVTVTLSSTVSLPLNGGATVLASMAGNANYIVVGTNQSTQPVEINKSTLAVSPVNTYFPPFNVHTVTADDYGYITIEFGKFGRVSSGSTIVGPDGAVVQDGGGSDFMLNTTQAILPQNLK